MFRHKHKNHYGTFGVKHSGSHIWRNKPRILIATFIVGIFVFGAGLVLFNKNKKPKEQALIQSAVIDSIPGWWYQQYFGSSVCDKDNCKPQADADSDKLTNEQEYFYQSDPQKFDTNSNGISDGQDVAMGFAPSAADKTKFEDLGSSENALGESLVFDQDVKQIINDMADPSKVKLPEVQESEIKISKDNSKQAMTAYLSLVNATVARYFNTAIADSFSAAAANGDDDQITDIKIRAIKLRSDLKTIPVPPDAVQLHKYYIALVGLIPQVVSVPGPTSVGTDSSQAEDAWYDSAQAYLVLIQKAAIEKLKLKL